MLWHIELKFCIWLCFTVLEIKFECRQFVSIFVGVMPLLELKILQIHSFPHFSLTCFDILSWNLAYDFVLLYYRSSSSVFNFCVSYAPFGTQNTENILFSALFSDMLWLIELKICTWLCFTEIKINFDCRKFASIFSSPEPKARVGYCHSAPSVVRPSVVRRPSVRKLSHFWLLL